MISPASPFKAELEMFVGEEYKAHSFYRQAALWCENEGWLKAAKYYAAEADSELEHAKKLQAFAVATGTVLAMPASMPQFTFLSLFNIVDQQDDLETALYVKYESSTRAAMSTDMSVFKLLQKMTQIQYDAIAETRTLKDIKTNLDPNSRLDVFMFEKQAYE